MLWENVHCSFVFTVPTVHSSLVFTVPTVHSSLVFTVPTVHSSLVFTVPTVHSFGSENNKELHNTLIKGSNIVLKGILPK